MPLYELEEATLNGMQGQGYAFKSDKAFGSTYQGVFFLPPDHEEDEVSGLVDGDPVEFSGRVYLKTTSNEETIAVQVTKTLRTGSGPRADFLSVDGIELSADEEE